MTTTSINSVKLIKLARHFRVTEKEAFDTVFRHGNYINIRLLCNIDGADSVSQEAFNEIMETDKRLLGMVFPEEAVKERAFSHVPFDLLPRVYFLIFNNEIVYVGQSSALCNRVMSHQIGNEKHKEFNKVATFEVTRKDINIIESVNIRHYRPLYNKEVMTKEEYFKRVLQHSFLE